MGAAFFVAIVIAAIVYVVSFKDDFTKAELDNITPVLAIIAGVVLLFNIMVDIGG